VNIPKWLLTKFVQASVPTKYRWSLTHLPFSNWPPVNEGDVSEPKQHGMLVRPHVGTQKGYVHSHLWLLVLKPIEIPVG